MEDKGLRQFWNIPTAKYLFLLKSFQLILCEFFAEEFFLMLSTFNFQ